ncbi:hypothetical protein CAL28_14645 [Bordetella genomosp. 11]|uniref:Uncharacterized protein n=1 Tax=Bordetella genomosp. 11 TaxID=1416808 RepID=A0A261UIE3_9BORD|nr:hypothetical protein CAL28_14645 [Bordetella genomosp. 11]
MAPGASQCSSRNGVCDRKRTRACRALRLGSCPP